MNSSDAGGGQPIGGLRSVVGIPYSFGSNPVMAHLNTMYAHIHGAAFVYPDHANDVTLTSAATVWGLGGSIIEVIPANAINHPFDIHWMNIASISANGTYQVDIFAGPPGSEVQISAARTSRSNVQSIEGAHRVQIPQQEANVRISCRLSDNTALSQTLLISFEGHRYGG